MIYLDNAATTKVSKGVIDAMAPYFDQFYGNPSSIYEFGLQSSKAVEESRKIIADSIGARPEEIYFTSCGTESDNWAIQGIFGSKQGNIVTDTIEHHAVLNACKNMEKKGIKTTYVPVDNYGLVSPSDIEDAINEDTKIVSVMFANNEVGTIEPIKEIGDITRERKIALHVDATQAYGHVPINVQKQKIDMLSASAHKLNGPKGIGFLYIRKYFTKQVAPLIYGGQQERNRRAGTENVPYIVGFAQAITEAKENMGERSRYEKKLRDYLIDRVLKEIPFSYLNGDSISRLPNNANFSFEGINSESALIMLDSYGICCSSGAACNSQALDGSYVLKAMGLPDDLAMSSIRLTLSHETTYEEIDYTVEKLKDVVSRLRSVNEFSY